MHFDGVLQLASLELKEITTAVVQLSDRSY